MEMVLGVGEEMGWRDGDANFGVVSDDCGRNIMVRWLGKWFGRRRWRWDGRYQYALRFLHHEHLLTLCWALECLHLIFCFLHIGEAEVR